MPTVYIVQQDNHKDFTAAEKYGETKIVFSRGLFADDAEERSRDMVQVAHAVLRKFDPANDFILLNGDPVGIAIAGAVLSELYDDFRCLKWDNDAKQYYPVPVKLVV